MPEVLVVLVAEGASNALADVRKRHPVVGVYPPRLVLTDVNEAEADALRRSATIQTVMTGPSDPLPTSLTDGERLFVQAWQERQRGGQKHRPGEGLNWDAEGFLPPDPPGQH